MKESQGHRPLQGGYPSEQKVRHSASIPLAMPTAQPRRHYRDGRAAASNHFGLLCGSTKERNTPMKGNAIGYTKMPGPASGTIALHHHRVRSLPFASFRIRITKGGRTLWKRQVSPEKKKAWSRQLVKVIEMYELQELGGKKNGFREVSF